MTVAPVRDALAAATDALTAARVDSPRLDAELLLSEASGLEREVLAADPERSLGAGVARAYGTMVRRRIAREPLAYIVGRKGFRRIELAVDRRALIPRPETELLVEVALESRPRAVLDIGTGSGAVALAVADELPDSHVTATDTSPDALALARENAQRLGLVARIRFEQGTVPAGMRFDLALANLPYVRENEWKTLPPEINRYEPREALVAGPDGLAAIRSLLATPPGCDTIALEVGAGQAAEVEQMVKQAGFKEAKRRKDLAGIERVVIGGRE